MGHIAIYCPLNKEHSKMKNWKYHVHETQDNKSDKERITKNEESSEEHVLISPFIGQIIHGSDTWLIDNGASKHMT